LATVYQAVSLYEEITAMPADLGAIEVRVIGASADQVPTDDRNLASKAAVLLAKRAGVRLGASLVINKSIPVAAGLAGGSADAAAALLACSVLWNLDLDHEDLLPLAAELGSDVPFALLGGTAVGSGRGETVAPALARGSYHWVLAFADQGLSTPAVYQRYDQIGPTPPDPFRVPSDLMNALRSGDAELLGRELINDLQAPAFDLMPSLRKLVAAGRDYQALGAVVSGSGPTVAFLAPDEQDAIDLTVALSASGLCRSARYVTGPVPGARVLAA
jgi:4-diphosphocytidyl-2-C-methyl-D-erythritol kinase